jgi:hypothetical protein
LDRPNFFPVDVVFSELGPEQFEEQQTLSAVDQIRIRNRVGRAREEVGQPHLISHRGGQNDESQVKRPGDVFENVAQQRLLGGM